MWELFVAYFSSTAIYTYIAPYMLTSCTGAALKVLLEQIFYGLLAVFLYIFWAIVGFFIILFKCLCYPLNLLLKLVCCVGCNEHILKKGRDQDEIDDQMKEISEECYTTCLGTFCCWFFERVEGEQDAIRCYKLFCCPCWWYKLDRHRQQQTVVEQKV